MSERVRIVVCYKSGTKDIFQIWFSSIMAYTKKPVRITAVTADDTSMQEAMEVFRTTEGTTVVQVCPATVTTPARIHGAMLDAFLSGWGVQEEFILTMDSDCFPVAEGWLDALLEMADGSPTVGEPAKVVGILHPWAPPPADMDHNRIEWRVRSQHCWETTHVACQMIRMDDLMKLQATFAGGDDTGLLIPLEAKKHGWRINGFRATRCARPIDGSDPEFNRYVCLIFGDAVYHHGGFTRVATMGDKPVMNEAYGWVRGELLFRREAEFLLDDQYSYRFKFDREEEVAKEKMDRLFIGGFGGKKV